MSIRCNLSRYVPDEQCQNRTRYGDLCPEHAQSLLGVMVSQSEIPDAGLGLFLVNRDVKRNEIICQYQGVIVPKDEYESRPLNEQVYGVDIGKGRILDSPETTMGFARFVNGTHGRSVNCKLVTDSEYGRHFAHKKYKGSGSIVWLVSNRDMEGGIGTELLLDYGDKYV